MAKTTSKTSKTKTSTAKKKSSAKEVKVPEEVQAPAISRRLNSPKLSRKNLIIALVVLLALGLGVWKYTEQQKQLAELKQSQKTAADLEKELVADVRKITVTPSDEEPIVREVENLESVAGQPFYSQAAIGDRVLLFSKAKRAILYRPSTKQVVNISNNIVIQNNSGQQPAGGEATP